MPSRITLLLLLLSIILLSLTFPSVSKFNKQTNSPAGDDDDDDLSFLEEDDDLDDDALKSSHSSDPDDEEDYADNFSDDDGDDFAGLDDGIDPPAPGVDDKDVVVLKERNFTDVIENNKYVMVEFYAPWCGHCQTLAPEYAAAATELKASGEDVVLAKVDATEETELSHEYDVQGFPTIVFFVDGEHKTYNGGRSKDAIVTWIRKKIGPGVYNITTTEEAEKILASGDKVVVAYLDSLVGSESKELAAASKVEDEVHFYQTVDPKVAKIFHIDAEAKRPALVLLKQEEEKISHFAGEFSKRAISEFVIANKLPLVITFTQESSSLIFESPIKKQILLFASSKDSAKTIPVYQEVAKSFKGKLVFVYVQSDDEEVGKQVAEYFGINGDAPEIIGYLGTEEAKKFVFDREMTLDGIKAFGEDFLAEKLKPFYKSDPIPESNDGDVKIVVGKNFEEIVLDESKDVLLEMYAPWCGHCQSLEPTYNKLAKHLKSVKSLVIAKMDGTTNEHPRVKAEGFPTIVFFPAGNKSAEPISVESERTVKGFYKFIKKHASVPFKLDKSVVSSKTEGDSLKDEL